MSIESKHQSVVIGAPVDVVYDYVVNPANLSTWASGLSSSTTLIDGRWEADSPMGRVTVAFAPRNSFGVLDHDVTLPSGEVVSNPVRLIEHPEGSELIFTMRHAPGVSSEDFARDAATVAADLATLKAILEAHP